MSEKGMSEWERDLRDAQIFLEDERFERYPKAIDSAFDEIDRLRARVAERQNPWPLINCPSCRGGNEATVRMDVDDHHAFAVWHCNLCDFEWVHESSEVKL